MIGGLPLGFAEPLVLIGLLTLPVLWWLLRLIPPRPRRIDFPPTRLLLEIAPKEETPARTPWWLTLLRLALAALVIIAAAGPLWNPPLATTQRTARRSRILIDDGWAAAAAWDARLRTADDIIARAEDDRRAVALIPLSEGTRDISFEPAGSARVRLHQIKPKPYTVDRTEALPAIARFLAGTPDVELVWLSDGDDLGRGADFVKASRRRSAAIRSRRRRRHCRAARAHRRRQRRRRADRESFARRIRRRATPARCARSISKACRSAKRRSRSRRSDRETEAHFDLPVEIRNDIARIEIAGERSAGAVQLLDKRWRRRTVGIVSGATRRHLAAAVVVELLYRARARPVRRCAAGPRRSRRPTRSRIFSISNLPMLILADVGNVAGDAHDRLAHWIEDGGVLVRFAGPRLAASDDDLVPVKLRRGGRILGGSLSWDKPQPLAAFSRESPFNGMPCRTM